MMMMAIMKTKLCTASTLLTENYLQFKKCDKYFFCKPVQTPTVLNVLESPSQSSTTLIKVGGDNNMSITKFENPCTVKHIKKKEILLLVVSTCI